MEKAFDMVNVHIRASGSGAIWTLQPARRVRTDGLTKPRQSPWIGVLGLAAWSPKTKKIKRGTKRRGAPT